MPERPPLDAALREQALDTRLCCIVQAPAGSGKTELLIQRMLALLAQVERPEEILAITFTRKAAGEMRARILHALREASLPLPPEAPEHLVRQRERARAALARDQAQGWNLLEQPGRLRIQTIDAFSHGLCARLPLTARFGAAAVIDEAPEALYREAATAVVERIERAQEDADVAALQVVLPHLGNDLARLAGLLAAMLARRDQWGRHLLAGEGAPGQRRAALEGAIRRMLEEELEALHALYPAALQEETRQVAAILCANLQAQGVGEDDRRLHWEVPGWPAPGLAGLARWQGLADLLLTDKGEWRQRLETRNGVPPPSAKGLEREAKAEREAFKARVQALIEALRQHPELASALHATRAMPDPAYGETDWAVLEGLLHLLKQAWVQLKLGFALRGRVDFIETAEGALRALGEPEAPSDLLLAYDYRLRHILVDEFQDTSHSQFALLERLISGWQPGPLPYTEAEGRSLFLVGDPMQSIYRFREAEVGLFLRAQREGIRCAGGVLRLAPLTLSANFRSQAGLVAWVNAVFPRVLAERENIAEGAVPYTPSQAQHEEAEGEAVRIHLLPRSAEGEGEALKVVQLAHEALARLDTDGAVRPADRSVAILVRSRGHLARILPGLRAAALTFQAVEIERLAAQPMVQDLLALTRALLHPADRIAWLAILRAPWCGLSLKSLTALAGGEEATLWQAMHDPARLGALEEAECARLERLREVLAAGLREAGRVPLRRQVEGVWLALGGPSCARDAREREEADIFFELLDGLGSAPDVQALERELDALYAPPEGQARIQVMTMHKAKGLQFHTVIVPGLARVPPPRSSQLLLWLEREARHIGHAETDLLLAPIKGEGEKSSLLYDWLGRILKAREGYEEGRLLYVAATRAIRRLELVAELSCDEEGSWQPPPRTLLARLWPGIAEHIADLPPPGPQVEEEARGGQPSGPIRLRRLPLDFGPIAPPPGPAIALPQTLAEPPVAPSGEAALASEEGADETLRHVGTLVHRLLERIASEGPQHWPESRLHALAPALRRALRELGVGEARLDEAQGRVIEALENTLADARGRWILAAHEEARSEWALGGMFGGQALSAVIDRSFIDEGVRWIIDYKTATPAQGEGLEAFLERQQARYRAQLETYAALLAALEPGRPLRLGLYFPLTGGWRAWAFDPPPV